MDARAILGVGVPGVVLMETAGRLATRVLLRRFPAECRRGVLVLCGRGNNGGDGYVMARLLRLAGVPVRVCAAGAPSTPDARVNRESCVRVGIPVDAPFAPGEAGIVVDALLGTGLTTPLQGTIAAMVRELQEVDRPVLAVDVPTGLCADTGAPLGGLAVRATVTVTFGPPKAGFFLEPGPDFVGDLVVADIGLGIAGLWDGIPAHPLSPEAEGWMPDSAMLRMPEATDVLRWLPVRPPGAHKGTSGHLAILAGSPEKAGAAVLCANAAARAGVGLVTLHIPREAWGRLHGLQPEVMVDEPDALEAAVAAAGRRYTGLAVGPGIGQERAIVDRVRRLWQSAPLPSAFDADGLNALVGSFVPSLHPRLVTPHAGEAGRLLGLSPGQVQAGRLDALAALSRVSPTLLKGRYTLVSGSVPWVNPTGSARLASAGSGDVLTGILGAFLARGLAPEVAGVLGAFVHGFAGLRTGRSEPLASEISAAVPDALACLHEARLPFSMVGLEEA